MPLNPLDFPDPDEEYDLRYADELDMLEEMANEARSEATTNSAKRTLVYSSETNEVRDTADPIPETSRKRIIDELNSSTLEDPTELTVSNEAKRFKTSAKEDIRKCLKETIDVLSLDNIDDLSDTDLSLVTRTSLEDTFRDKTPEKKVKVWKRIPPGNFMPVTSTTKERVYLCLRSESYVSSEISAACHGQMKALQLLLVPYAQLRQEAEIELEKKMIRESCSKDGQRGEVTDNVSSGNVELWVEKYKPRHYLELLSDEGINRMVLHWLKLWDKFVFGKKFVMRKKKDDGKTGGNKNQQGKFKKFRKPELNDELDADGFPAQKIALLCGPPGLGKTTLAHILALHAGYNPLEMNASDDRSPEAFRTQIEASTQMRSVFGENPKPNCLIIDEIDGAPADSINLLVSMALGKPTAGKDATAKKKKNAIKPLLRPVICICNELYVPALRTLRQNALVIAFPPTLPTRLATRLQEIVRPYRFRVDLTTLLALCEKAENDIRSCLSTLQFVYQRSGRLTSVDVQSMSIGQKDMQKSLFALWHEIFHKPKPSKKNIRYQEGNADSVQPVADTNRAYERKLCDNTSIASRFINILHLVQASDEYDKLFQGLYENYLNVKVNDSYLDSVTSGAEWLVFSDILNHEIHSNQEYALYPYLPYCCVIFHLLFASATYTKISYPSAHFESQAKLKLTNHVLEAVGADMAPSVRAFANPLAMVTDILPYLLLVIQPTLRPVNTQLYTAREKEDLQHLVQVMVAYNLTYVPQRTVEGTYEYVFEPNVEAVARFAGMKPPSVFPYSSKQMIAREIETEKMRRSDEKNPTKAETAQRKIENQAKKPNQETPKPVIPIKFEEQVAVDFFGRPISAEQQKKKSVDGVNRTGICYRFKEGYSNAVRRKIHIKDFL